MKAEGCLHLIEFLHAPGVTLDVRSPGEYCRGRIPGALSLPLFTNEERAQVGTVYKQAGRRQAVAEGLELIAPKVIGFIEQAAKWADSSGMAKVHCWRGGMRSSSMALLLEMAGIPCVTLRGGYKAFRRWALQTLEKPCKVFVLGGMTGSGKTAVLKALKEMGEQVLDLENIAGHRGSSFGIIGMPPQPSAEQFENEMACRLHALDPSKPLWVEDESRMIGTCKIPDGFFKAMQAAPLFLMERPLEERLANLRRDYWGADRSALVEGTQRLANKLGGARTKEIIGHIEAGEMQKATVMLLEYYDAAYRHSLQKRQRAIHPIKGGGLSDWEWSGKLLGLPALH